jgi:predicted membrane protein
MKNNSKNVVVGLVLILFAVSLFLDKLGMFPELPIIKIGISIILIYVIAVSLKKLEFLGITFPLGLIACLFSTELGIDKVSPAIIIIVSVLIGVGLSLIFGKSKVKVITEGGHKGCNVNFDNHTSVEYNQSEGTFDVDNNLGNKTEYVNVKDLTYGKIDNAMGSLTVYLNGTTIAEGGASINADNGLGNLVIYIPKEFRVSMTSENGLGRIDTHGTCSQDSSLPVLNLHVENGLGSVEIYFE